jgi:hypothetical protein
MFTKEFKLAAVQRLEQGVSLGEFEANLATQGNKGAATRQLPL